MGGLLAAALACLQPRDVAGLMLLATPWDFHAEKPELARAVARSTAPWMPLFDALGVMPLDVLQGLFSALDPFQVVRKFCAFARLDPTSERAQEFVALEDWLNDGVPLAAGVAKDCLLGWYGENTPGCGAWHVAGQTVAPSAIKTPTLVVVPEQDRIVPPLSARALAQAIPHASVLSAPLGHIGMVSSRRAPAELWPQITGWLAGQLALREAAGL
jgi:polyhydroxyalkanoate synthase